MSSFLTSWQQWTNQSRLPEELAVKSTILLAAAFALTGFLKRRHPLVGTGLWNATLLGLLVLPVALSLGPRFAVWPAPVAEMPAAPSESVPDERQHPMTDRGGTFPLPRDEVDIARSTAPALPQAEAIHQGDVASAASPGISIRGVLLLVAGLGVIIALLRLWMSILATLRLQRTAMPVAEAAWLESVSRWSDELGIRRSVGLRSTPEVHVPIVVGAVQPTILLPVALLEGRYAGHIDAIVAHELAHVKRSDYAWQLLLRFLQAIYWYHPLIWVAESRIAVARERACDEFGVYAVGSSERFADTLLAMAERMVQRPGTSLGLAVLRSPRIAHRLEAISSSQGTPRCWLPRHLTVLLLSLGLLIACGLAGAAAVDDAPSTGQPDTERTTTAVVDHDLTDGVDAYGDPLPPMALLRLGTARFRQAAPQNSETSVAYSPSGDVLATTDGGSINLWNAATGERIRRLKVEFPQYADGPPGRTGSVAEIAYSPRENELAAKCSDNMIRIWNSTTGEEFSILVAGPADLRRSRRAGFMQYRGFGYSPDGKKIAVVWNRRVRVYDKSTGELLQTLGREDGSGQFGLAWSPDGDFIAQSSRASRDPQSMVELWNVATGEFVREYRVDFEGFTTSLAISPDGQTLAAGCRYNNGDQRVVCLWDLGDGRLKATWRSNGSPQSLHFTPDSETLVALVATTGQAKIDVWDVLTGQLRHRIDADLPNTRAAALSPDGNTVALGPYGSADVRQFDVATGRQVRARFIGHSAEIRRAAYSPDGRLIATGGGNREVRLWDAETGQHVAFVDLPFNCYSLAFDPTGNQVAVAGLGSGEISIRDARTGLPLRVLDEGEERIRQVAYSHDGKALVTVGSNAEPWNSRPVTDTLHVWDPSTGRHLRQFEFTAASTESMTLLPDNRSVVLGAAFSDDYKAVQVRDLQTGEQLQLLTSHQASVNALDYAAGLVVSGARDRLIRLWDAETWDIVAILGGHDEEITSVALSRDGKWIASADEGGSIRLWDITSRSHIHEFTGVDASCLSLCFSPDGDRLVTAMTDGTAIVWDARAARRGLAR